MTLDGKQGKEFAKWLKEWRSEIRIHVSLRSIDAEKREDENEAGADKDTISKRNGIIPEPTVAIKQFRVGGRFEHH
jgi:hypothetical protein